MTKIKPCPFCGYKAKTHIDGMYFYVECSSKKCMLQPHTERGERKDVIKAWNTRTP